VNKGNRERRARLSGAACEEPAFLLPRDLMGCIYMRE